MAKEQFSIREIIEQAIRTEQLGYEFYNSMSDRFKKEERLKSISK